MGDCHEPKGATIGGVIASSRYTGRSDQGQAFKRCSSKVTAKAGRAEPAQRGREKRVGGAGVAAGPVAEGAEIEVGRLSRGGHGLQRGKARIGDRGRG